MKDFFYPTLCHRCKTPTSSDSPLKKCSGCKLVFYCCQNHLGEDWPLHKKFCKTIAKYLEEEKKDSIYPTTEMQSRVEYVKAISNVIKMVYSKLGRALSDYEREILLFSPACNYCLRFSSQCVKWFCEKCLSVVYCCKDHRSADTPHKMHCEELRLCLNLSIQFRKRPVSLPSKVVKLPRNFPSSTSEFIASIKPQLKMNPYSFSEIYSSTMTLLNGIRNCGDFGDCRSTKLRIHVLGPGEFEQSFLHNVELIFHVLKKIKHIDILFIGPQVPPTYNDALLCSDCEKDRSITFQAYDVAYHSFVSSKRGLVDCIIPDVMLAFNCGFSEFKNSPKINLWKPTFAHLKNFKNILLFTSYTKQESEQDFKEVIPYLESDAISASVRHQRNPFRSLFPRRDWEAFDEPFFYVNNYWTMFSRCKQPT